MFCFGRKFPKDFFFKLTFPAWGMSKKSWKHSESVAETAFSAKVALKNTISRIKSLLIHSDTIFTRTYASRTVETRINKSKGLAITQCWCWTKFDFIKELWGLAIRNDFVLTNTCSLLRVTHYLLGILLR